MVRYSGSEASFPAAGQVLATVRKQNSRILYFTCTRTDEEANSNRTPHSHPDLVVTKACVYAILIVQNIKTFHKYGKSRTHVRIHVTVSEEP